jgi:hypothetical protein
VGSDGSGKIGRKVDEARRAIAERITAENGAHDFWRTLKRDLHVAALCSSPSARVRRNSSPMQSMALAGRL